MRGGGDWFVEGVCGGACRGSLWRCVEGVCEWRVLLSAACHLNRVTGGGGQGRGGVCVRIWWSVLCPLCYLISRSFGLGDLVGGVG